jgi:hypothetical protein
MKSHNLMSASMMHHAACLLVRADDPGPQVSHYFIFFNRPHRIENIFGRIWFCRKGEHRRWLRNAPGPDIFPNISPGSPLYTCADVAVRLGLA